MAEEYATSRALKAPEDEQFPWISKHTAKRTRPVPDSVSAKEFSPQ